MKIRFTDGYRGILTGEHYFKKGSVTTLEDSVAAQIIAQGKAEAVVTPEAKPAPKPKASERKPSRTRSRTRKRKST